MNSASVRSQVDRIHEELESHRLKMTQDIARLDKLYEVTLEYFHDLGNYIIAAEERLRRLDEEEIPRLRAQAESEADGEMLATQKLADLSNARNDLERKLRRMLVAAATPISLAVCGRCFSGRPEHTTASPLAQTGGDSQK